MSGRARINIPKEAVADLCRRHHIRELALFGSVLSDSFGPDSDVDVLVQFEPGRTPGFAFCEIASELSSILGREVDLHTPNSLSRYFRDKVLAEAEVEYAL
ncbi:MAG TPA: nucleotidyltransferase family protein [Blastocatellia bacterium]|nr:nucleotidyltransferase family protein [Blastocatellia bacterium]